MCTKTFKNVRKDRLHLREDESTPGQMATCRRPVDHWDIGHQHLRPHQPVYAYSHRLFQFLRDICGGKLLQNPVQLGGIDATGAGIICEIDESCFRHKTKYHRGRAPKRNQWVYGIVDTSSTPATGFLRMVNRRDAATLLPIIQNVIGPGSVINSVQWCAYTTVSSNS